MSDNKIDLTPIVIPGHGIPEDSRLKGYTKRVQHPTLPLERTYCTKCGAPFGWVSTESYEAIRVGEVVVFCNSCEESMNKLGGVPLVPAAPDNATEIPRQFPKDLQQEFRR